VKRGLAGASGLLVALGLLTRAGPASADDLDADLRGYYGGERASAYFVGALGAAAAGAGAYLATQPADLARGLGWTWIGMGTLEVAGAVVYATAVGGEITHYESSLSADPAAFRAEEADHLRGTSSRFVIYRTVELTLTAAGAGLAAYGLASGRGAFTGAGIGVASLSAPFFVVDTINDARASRYLRQVQGGDGGAPRVSLGATPGGAWGVTWGGRF
jgi:hypothetical protein